VNRGLSSHPPRRQRRRPEPRASASGGLTRSIRTNGRRNFALAAKSLGRDGALAPHRLSRSRPPLADARGSVGFSAGCEVLDWRFAPQQAPAAMYVAHGRNGPPNS
jgi:hypothetical protein